jgi:MFS family permease
VKIVNNKINLKEIQKKTYTSYHQDGLLDIFASVYVIGFALGIIINILYDFDFALIMPAILVAVVIPIWISAKRKITMPRIGFVKFEAKEKNKLMAVLLGMAVAGILAFLAFGLTQSDIPFWQDVIIPNAMIIVGIGSLAFCALFGSSMGLKRLYGYGILSLTLLTIGHFTGIFFAYIILALGITVMVTGFTLLIKFVKKYPIQGEK